MSQELIKLPTKEFKVEAGISHESTLQDEYVEIYIDDKITLILRKVGSLVENNHHYCVEVKSINDDLDIYVKNDNDEYKNDLLTIDKDYVQITSGMAK